MITFEGVPVTDELSLRTKEACEEICINGGGRRPIQNNGTSSATPTPNNTSGTPSNTNGTPSNTNGYENPSTGTTTPNNPNGFSNPSTGTTASLPANTTNHGRHIYSRSYLFTMHVTAATTKTCARLPYKLRCGDTLNAPYTQFTLRWYLGPSGMCCSYPWGYCEV
jgi:hypothetical protein